MPTGEKRLRQGTRGGRTAQTSDEPERGSTDHVARRRALEDIDSLLDDSDEFRLPSRWVDEWMWVGLLAIALLAFGLALYGAPHGGWARLEDALHLFPSGFPGHQDNASGAYVAASYLAAGVTLFATATLVLVALRGHVERLRARFARGHVVVIGLGEKGLRVGRGLRARSQSVTCLTLDPTGDAADDLRARGARVIRGDAMHEASLRTSAIARARMVVCATGADSVNAQIAARLIRGEGRPDTVYAHVANPELAHMLRTAALQIDDVRLHFFNIYATWARALLRGGPLGIGLAGASTTPRIAVIGTSDLARALLVRACRRWHFGAVTPDRMSVLVVAADALDFCNGITARYPALLRRSELVPISHEASVKDPSALAELDAQLDAVYVCLADDGESLGVALQARYQLGAEGPEVVVPASPWTRGLRSVLGPQEQRITIARYPLADPLDLLRDTLRESLARAVHAAYLGSRRDARDWRERPADVDWEDLDEAAREASRAHVDTMLEQLESLWYEVAPLFDWDEPPVELDEEQIEVLAQLEHERWCRELAAAGWQYGPERTDRRHPLLVPWDKLPPMDAELDRDLARSRPTILARAGYRLVHVPERETLARLIHRAYEREPGRDVPPWELLGDEQKELNRDAVDDIPLKLFAAGFRLQRRARAADQVAFAPDVVEHLAEREHDRWCRARARHGWRYGDVRDDERRLHPDLVPWAELPDARRQIDRDQVLRIPSLLAAVGYGAVRLGAAASPLEPATVQASA